MTSLQAVLESISESAQAPPVRVCRRCFTPSRLAAILALVLAVGAAMPAVSASAASATSYAGAVLGEPSLAHYWRLGDAPGSTTALDSRDGGDGTYVGGVTLGQRGALAGDANTAAGFGGSNGYVQLASLGSASDFTIEGWTNLTSGATASPSGNNTLYGSGGNVRLIVRPGGFYAGAWIGGTEYAVQAATASNVGDWVYWAMVRSGSTLTVYRNSDAVGSISTLPTGTTATVTLAGTIGAQGGSGYFLHGSVDEVAIYTSALPASAIQQHFALASPYAGAVLGESSLAHYWRLGEGSGSTTAVDLKGTARGTYVGGVTLGQPGALAGDPNTAAGFDGSTGYVSMSGLGSASASDFTLEGWTNLNSGAASNPNGNNALYGARGAVRLLVRPGGVYVGVWVAGNEYRVQVSTAGNVGSWVYWALVRSGSTLTVYRDGSNAGSISTLPTTGSVSLTGTIGAQGGSGYFLHGIVDEVAIYTSALPPSTIQQHDVLATGADLATTMSPTGVGGVTNFGNPVSFTATVTNNGPYPADNVVVSDSFIAATFRSITWPFGAASCTTPPVAGTGAITCNAGTLQPGQQVTLTVGLTARCIHNQLVSNSATATSSTYDPTNGDNTASGALRCN